MRITNVEKFRNDLYEALKDTFEWAVEMPSAIFKNGVEYKDTMTEYTHYETIDGTLHAVSLPYPIEIEDGKLYLIVSDEGVEFWRSKEKYYTYVGCCDFELYRNKFSFIASLVLRISDRLEKQNNKPTGGGETARKEVAIMEYETTWNEEELEEIETLNEIFNL